MKNSFNLSPIVKSAPLSILAFNGARIDRDIDYSFANGEKLISLIRSKKFGQALKLVKNSKMLDVENELDFTCIDYEGNTALHLAVKNNKLKLVKAIVDACSPLSKDNFLAQTPLNISKERGSISITKYLELALVKESEVEEGILQNLSELRREVRELEIYEVSHRFLQSTYSLPLVQEQFFSQTSYCKMQGLDDFSTSLKLSSGRVPDSSREESISDSGSISSTPIDIIYPGSRSVEFEDVGAQSFEVGSIPTNIKLAKPLPKKLTKKPTVVKQKEVDLSVGCDPILKLSDELIFSFDEEDFSICIGVGSE